ncbi:hypothetical protein SELMODRAFT_114915 [Selaginella moellendorffii]|uniref:Pentacotripeptide-repeat region of PRORP domain-containing protein n=1 Tax=Selaginella moellendorffii TaxID=88036 RepID=D8SEN9_SELML|nr:hypothetical protein SELMODRAFT_114915 [Selaginella moellendorffii]
MVFKASREKNLATLNAMLVASSKSGNLEESKRIFDQMPEWDVISWTTMIIAYTQHGHLDAARRIFTMAMDAVHPNDVTFLGVFVACAHLGQVAEIYAYLASMEIDYGIVPTQDHYSCIVSALGRLGQLKAAMEMIQRMPTAATAAAWESLLSCYRFQRDPRRGIDAAKQILEIEPQNAAGYVLLSNALL